MNGARSAGFGRGWPGLAGLGPGVLGPSGLARWECCISAGCERAAERRITALRVGGKSAYQGPGPGGAQEVANPLRPAGDQRQTAPSL